MMKDASGKMWIQEVVLDAEGVEHSPDFFFTRDPRGFNRSLIMSYVASKGKFWHLDIEKTYYLIPQRIILNYTGRKIEQYWRGLDH